MKIILGIEIEMNELRKIKDRDLQLQK